MQMGMIQNQRKSPDNMYSPKIREDLIPRIYILRKIRNKPMTDIVNEILTDYLDRMEAEHMSSGTESRFIRSLRPYSRPKRGERIETEYGRAEIIEVKDYDEVIGEMQRNGVSEKEIEGFNIRVKHFLGDLRKYFECLIHYEDGEFDTIDWSEYLAIKNKKSGKNEH